MGWEKARQSGVGIATTVVSGREILLYAGSLATPSLSSWLGRDCVPDGHGGGGGGGGEQSNIRTQLSDEIGTSYLPLVLVLRGKGGKGGGGGHGPEQFEKLPACLQSFFFVKCH